MTKLPKAPIPGPVRPIIPLPNTEAQQPASEERIQWLMIDMSYDLTPVDGRQMLINVASIRSVQPSGSWFEHSDHNGNVIPEQGPLTTFHLLDGNMFATAVPFHETLRMWPALAKTVHLAVAEVPLAPAEDSEPNGA